MKDPLLRRVEWKDETGSPHLLIVRGGLHMIRGNHAPYFSLTGTGWLGGQWDLCGAMHDRILEKCPEFADLAALHLSDIDGVPMHAGENAFYHMGGCTEFRPGGRFAPLTGLSFRPDPPPYTANWAHAAGLLRITEEACRALARNLFGDSYSETGGFLSSKAERDAKARLLAWCETQKPRWKAEADACIARHGLVVYGDPWPVPAKETK